jgi:predicted O-methyltransferase YrrM
MTLEAILKDSPKLHRIETYEISYRLSDEALRFIDSQVGEGQATLETGAGISTILFAIKRARHISVVPDSGRVRRIQDYCRQNNISVESVDFQVNRSENVLPQLDVDELDFVLIDGRHAFPTPFIDWYYTASKLKVGGLLLIDDTQLWTGQVLKRFLMDEPEWKLVKSFSLRAAAFVKLREYNHEKWWGQQSYVVTNSREWMRRLNARQAFALLRHWQAELPLQRMSSRAGLSERTLSREGRCTLRAVG